MKVAAIFTILWGAIAIVAGLLIAVWSNQWLTKGGDLLLPSQLVITGVIVMVCGFLLAGLWGLRGGDDE